MSKYNLTDILNEYIGGGRIGTLKISYKDLVDKMDELEKSGKVIVRERGSSADGKVNREFEVVDRDSAVPGGKKQERGFTVYDYKFGFDPGSEAEFMNEYPFSVGGNDLKLAMELIDGVEPYRMEENIKEDEFDEARQAAIESSQEKAGIREENVIKDLAQADEVIKMIKMMNPDVREDLLKRIARMGQKMDEKMSEQMYIDDDEFNKEMGRSKKDALKLDIIFHVDQLIDGNIDMNDFMNVVEEIMAEVKSMKEVMNVDRKGKKKSDKKSNLTGGAVTTMKEEIAPTGIGISGDQLKNLIKLGAIAGVEVFVRDKDGKNVRKVDYTLTNTDFEKDPERIDVDYIDENEGQEALKEHFTRFMFKKYS